jgi:hypothetical protein
MDIREVGDAPLSTILRAGREGEQITRLVHCRIRDAPREGREGKVDAHDDDRIRKCDRHEKVQ